MFQAISAAASRWTSPKKTQQVAASTAVDPALPPPINGVPRDWIGIKSGQSFQSVHNFPCIGTACAARGGFHQAGTRAQGFRDFSDAHYQKETEWQHMCLDCAGKDSEVQAWRSRYDARRRRAVDATAAQEEARCELLEDEAIEAAFAAIEAEADQPTLTAATTAETMAAAAAVDATEAATEGVAEVAEAAPAEPPAEPPAEQPASQPPRFIAHAEQRKDLGKPLWAAVAPKIPRVGHDGRLHMPQGGAAVDLKALRREFPALPFITPAPAAARAAQLLQSSPDSSWTRELMEQARSCFECEAASIELAVVMPEVTAREQLMEDERYLVKEQGCVVGCKLFCPGCKSNQHVLVGDVNLDHETSVRFAYGNGRAILSGDRSRHQALLLRLPLSSWLLCSPCPLPRLHLLQVPARWHHPFAIAQA